MAATLGVAVGSVVALLDRAERAFRERYRERYSEPDGGETSVAPTPHSPQEHTDDRHLS